MKQTKIKSPDLSAIQGDNNFHSLEFISGQVSLPIDESEMNNEQEVVRDAFFEIDDFPFNTVEDLESMSLDNLKADMEAKLQIYEQSRKQFG